MYDMNTTQITIRTDAHAKQAIAAFAKKLGLSTGAFMMAAARDAMDKGKVTLRDPEYNPKFVQMIREAEAEYERGEYYTAKTPEDALAHLDKLTERSHK